MYQWLYSDNPYRAYPLFALGVFLIFFVGVFVGAYWPRGATRFEGTAMLPLEDGNE